MIQETNNIKTFTKDFINCDPLQLAAKCIALALIEGMANVETYIKNTFCKKEASQLISVINLILKSA